MSIADDRIEITAALATVDELFATELQPTTLGTGACWPTLTGLERDETTNEFLASWRILVATGGDPISAVLFMDEHLQDVVDALQTVVWVTSIAPVDLTQLTAGDMFGIEIRAVRE